MTLKNCKYLIVIFILLACNNNNSDTNLKLLNFDIKDYMFFNEILWDDKTNFYINHKEDILTIKRGDIVKSYIITFHRKNVNIIKDDMVINFYDLKIKNDTIYLKTDWLPEEFTINWKDEYWKYKKNGIQLIFIKE